MATVCGTYTSKVYASCIIKDKNVGPIWMLWRSAEAYALQSDFGSTWVSEGGMSVGSGRPVDMIRGMDSSISSTG
jgi:hypothetical protein